MKTLRFYIFCFLLIFITSGLKAQEKTYLGDTAKVEYIKYPNVDSVVYIKGALYSRESPWIVYFDKEEKSIAFESYRKGDSVYEDDFWRNGKLKQRYIMIKEASGNYMWCFEETHCENGQLMTHYYPNRLKRQQIVTFYCNGNKKFKSSNYSDDNEVVTDSSWYENGKLESVTYSITMFNGICRKHHNVGEWKYYNVNGGLDSMHVYEDAEKLHYPDCDNDKPDTSKGKMTKYSSCIPGESGIEKTYYPDGKIKVEGLIFDKKGHHVRDGVWWYYSESGNKIKTEYYDKGKLLKTIKGN